MTVPQQHETVETRNEVRLLGRVSDIGEERSLPSGDALRTLRLVVDRDGTAARRQKVDVVECVLFTTRLRRQLDRWQVGDVVAVTGALRKRFFQTPRGLGSRVEVEVTAARRVRPARA